MLNVKELILVFFILFFVIDIIGNVFIVIDLKCKGIKIELGKVFLVVLLIMIFFLYGGEVLLYFFGVDVVFFVVVGVIIIFIIGLEMIFGVEIFKY